jgi:hypothetical protein
MSRHAKAAGVLVAAATAAAAAIPALGSDEADRATPSAKTPAMNAKVGGRVARVAGRQGRRPAGLYLVRNRMVRGGRGARASVATELDVTPYAPLIGDIAPAAQISPDGMTLVYDSWQWTREINWERGLASQGIRPGGPLGTPGLRLRDLDSGAETTLPAGTLSAAFRSDGALAYAHGTTASYLSDTPYLRSVVVRDAEGKLTTWSPAPDQYTVLAWAGERLIAQRAVPTQLPDLVVFDAPGKARLLAPGSSLIALDPEGERALVATGSVETEAAGIGLVSLADGQLLSKVPLSALVDPATGQRITWSGGPGSWEADRVVFGSTSGMTVVRVQGSQLTAAEVVRVQTPAADADPIVHEPRFTDAAANTVVGWSTIGGEDVRRQRGVQYQCNLAARSCSQVLTRPADTPRPVYEMSEGSE